MKQENLDFLMFISFGICADDTEKTKAYKCAKSAYLDVCRTLTYLLKENLNKEQQKERHEYVKETCICIINEIKEFIFEEKTITYDEWHEATCKKITDLAEEKGSFENNKLHDGQAQKWLNMTIKNLLVIELWEDKLNKFRKDFHVPVDNFILNAAEKVKRGALLKDYNLGLKINSDSWSKWDYKMYIKFQKDIRKALENKPEYDSPIDWEYKAWLEVSKENKMKEFENI